MVHTARGRVAAHCTHLRRVNECSTVGSSERGCRMPDAGLSCGIRHIWHLESSPCESAKHGHVDGSVFHICWMKKSHPPSAIRHPRKPPKLLSTGVGGAGGEAGKAPGCVLPGPGSSGRDRTHHACQASKQLAGCQPGYASIEERPSRDHTAGAGPA